MAITKVSTELLKDNSVTINKLHSDTVVTVSKGLHNHVNDNGIPTAGAVASYVSSQVTGANNWDLSFAWGDHSTYGYATETYVDNSIANVINSAPVALDTLNELAAALGDDPNFATTVSTSIGTAQSTANTALTNANAALAKDPTLTISGDASGSATFTNLGNATLSLTIADDSHSHIISNIDGLQSALDGKQAAGTYNTIIGTDSDINTSGATIVDNIFVTDGVITSMGTRVLTLGDLGYTGATNANYITNNNQLTNGAGYTTNVGDITGVTAGNGISGGGTSGTVTISHADTSSQGSINNSGATVIQDIYLDTYGHITGMNSKAITLAELGYTGATNANYITNNNQLTNGAGYITFNDTNANSNHLNSTRDAPSNSLQYWQTSGLGTTEAPSTDWHNTIRMGHGNPLSYYSNTLAIRMTGTGVGDIYTQTIVGGVAQGWKKHWNNVNDGSGSGLDADLLDGVQGSQFLRSDANDTATGSLRFQNDLNYFGLASGNNEGEIVINTGEAGSPQIGFTEHGDASWAIGIDDADNSFKFHGVASAVIPTINNLTTPLFEITTTAGTAYLNGNTVWHAGNDGSGSGLDADLLDGLQGSQFLRSDIGGAISGNLTVGSGASSYIYMLDSDHGTRAIHNNSNRIGFLTSASGWGSYCNDNGDWVTDFISYAGASMRAPIFYDSNNTAYYTNPASTSNLNALNVITLTETSALRFKENIKEDIDASLVDRLRPVSYDWKQTKEKDYGFIAEEVNELDEDLVTKNTDGEMSGIKYTKLIPFLVKKIQEQEARIKQLENGKS